MVLSGINEKRDLVEIVELADHPWFVGVQFHPEFKSRPNRPHPLFVGFLGACGAPVPGYQNANCFPRGSAVNLTWPHRRTERDRNGQIGRQMGVSCVIGTQWGDEGKGKIVDFLAAECDLVVRFQGSDNAGHTVVNEFGRFGLHLVPVGDISPRGEKPFGAGHRRQPRFFSDRNRRA